ncbi:MAG: zinc-ribbon domain-containing protein [Candidatus Helarchaeota archaeon]
MEIERPPVAGEKPSGESSSEALSTLKKKIKDLSEKLILLEKERNDLVGKNQAIVSESETRVKELKNQIQILQRELISVKSEKQELENKTKMLSSESDQQAVKLTSQIESLNQQILQLQEQNRMFQSDYQARLADKDEEIKKLSEETLKLTEYIQRIKEEKEILENVKIASEKKINELKLEHQKFQDLQSNLQQKDQDIIRLKTKIQELENKLTSAELELQAFRAQQENLKKDPLVLGTILKKIGEKRYEVEIAGKKFISSPAVGLPEDSLKPGCKVAVSQKNYLMLELVSNSAKEPLLVGTVQRKTDKNEIMVQISGTNYVISNSFIPFSELTVGSEVGIDLRTHTIVKILKTKRPDLIRPNPPLVIKEVRLDSKPIQKSKIERVTRPILKRNDKESGMKFCVHCGTKNRDKAVFCSFCGSKFNK